jgi:predicted CxxxxCH...CXXCH cytochrome family protein
VHLNGAGQPIQAEVNFTAMASHVTAVTPVPSYSFSTNKCSNTYCHGNWRLRASESANSWIYTDSVMVGANFSPKWNGGPSQAACGTCHGLPPTGHDNSDTNCGDCHSEIDASNPFHVVDPTKHMNGVPDL